MKAPEDYTPQGAEDKLGDLPVYFVGDAAAAKGAVIVLPEVFGWQGRLKGICDTLAQNGYFAVLPDPHRGETAEGKEDLLGWLKGCEEKKPVVEDLKAVLAFIESKGLAGKPVGSVGHCYGVWAFCKASAEGLPLKCGVGPHPSIKLEEYAFGKSQADLCKAVAMPVLLMAAGNDPDNVKEGGELVDIFKGKGGGGLDFPDMSHGWFSRGDLADEKVKRDTDVTMKRTLEFLEKNMA